ncbi:maleate isomerase [Polaromonas sp. OV174]|uniref:maleate cis-trans isomerase family protein n=1 Tax=Polaromonas sp. OV174 TaxID=1855300 RepID=UPI0008F2372B|nr:aspartate/glutamate racemase family protein [Polaromonas sp. OV174]SFC03206.1 maleate isomerase [Polaromonas sp. OV174]
MKVEYASKGLIGLLTPQANTTVEPEFSVLLPPGYAHINARLVSKKETIEGRLLDYLRIADQTADQFANAPIEALALGCTGASYLAGREQEESLLEQLGARRGITAFTAATALVDCLAQMGARRIALATPYPEGLTQKSVKYWESHGLTVVKEASAAFNSTNFHPIYSLSAAQANSVLGELGSLAGVDALVMLGTGMPTLEPLLQANREAKGVPVLSCMLCLAWKAVELVNPGGHSIQSWLVGEHWAPRLEALKH